MSNKKVRGSGSGLLIVVAFLFRSIEEQTLYLHSLLSLGIYVERGPPYVLNIELNRIPAYFQLNGNNRRKKSLRDIVFFSLGQIKRRSCNHGVARKKPKKQ